VTSDASGTRPATRPTAMLRVSTRASVAARAAQSVGSFGRARVGLAGRAPHVPDCETPPQLTASTTSTRARPLHNNLGRPPSPRAQDPAGARAARTQPSCDPATRTGPGVDSASSTAPCRQPGPGHSARGPRWLKPQPPRTCHRQAPADSSAARTLPLPSHPDRERSTPPARKIDPHDLPACQE
jgi:hypothetical protein